MDKEKNNILQWCTSIHPTLTAVQMTHKHKFLMKDMFEILNQKRNNLILMGISNYREVKWKKK